MNAEKIRVGLIGCGNAGRTIHMPMMLKHEDLYQVVCCADVVAQSAKNLARDFNLCASESVEALLESEEVELVLVITSPPVTHHDLALQAFTKGKHVVVEKPMAGSSTECMEMVEAAKSAGRLLAVHHNRRWDVDFLTARMMVESGVLGQIRFIRNEYTAGFEGSCYDWGIHLVDQTMALSLGQPFVELTATFCKPNITTPFASEGFFSCRLRTADGVLHDLSMFPVVNGSAYLPGKMSYRFFLAGTQGVAYQEWCQRPQDAFMRTFSMQSGEGGKPVGDLPAISTDLAVPDFYTTLFHAIRNEGPLPVSGEEGCRAVKAWELICQSACENKSLQVSL